MDIMKLTPITRLGRHGFALVVTVSLMVLLVIVSVGLLGLSAIALRNSGQSQAQAEARANARLALQIAIGELQKQLGPDQRVSANGAIMERLNADGSVAEPARNRHWTGVWDSWKAGPGEASQHRTILGVPDEMAPDYQPNRRDSFRAWLLSLGPDESLNPDSAKTVTLSGSKMPSGDAAAVQLVADGSLGKAAKAEDFVSARLLSVGASASGSTLRGRYGWWVGDESQKSRILADSHLSATAATSAEKVFRTQAPGSTGTTTVKGLESMTNDSQLKGLPSLRSLDLVSGATGKPSENFHSITPFSYQVLADVREGGLKRDLSTLLERPIDIAESGDEFMLYKFNDKERVPIQDLAAYFQLYHQSVGDAAVGNKGVQYSSAPLASGIQITTPIYGGASDRDKFHRQYTGLYRSPVPIKLQFLLGLVAKPRARADITAQYPATHEMYLTYTMGMTLWNPTNLPLVMDTNGRLFQRIRWWELALGMRWNKNGWTHDAPLKNIMAQGGNFCELDISRNVPLVFAPGEVKILSLPYDPNTTLDFQRWDGENSTTQRLLEGWDPNGFMPISRSVIGAPNQPPHIKSKRLLFSEGDQIQLTINAESTARQAMFFQLGQDSYHDVGIQLERSYYNYTLGTQDNSGLAFNKSLMMRGFEGNAPITVDVPTTTLINGSAIGEPWPFLNFSLMAGAETSEDNNASGIGGASGRKFASRPFLHSSAIRPGTIDADNPDSFYNCGWNWWIEPINSVLEAPVQVTDEGKGYYGGGYGPGFGTNHVVQQEIPVVPPMSIASLSHAHLGGFSLSNSIPTQPWDPILEPRPLATGRGGLFPNTLQAIGNSYAHPLLQHDEAYDDALQRTFRSEDGPTTVVFADHSYLANKALWDEFFFSSITPQPDTAKIFETASRNAKEVAREFFFNDKPLPNRRMTPYSTGLDETTFDAWFTPAQQQQFSGGLADRIAAHLMVEGPFNINSTSVDAWKALLSSLKGKPVAYLEKVGDLQPVTTTPGGTPVGAFSLSNGKPVGSTNDPSEPGQWTSSRELGDTEIEQLATAIVKQVKRRGPFLSLSEFVNRRLDSNNKEFSVKGALQAALDDEEVSINAGFRNPTREFSAAEKAGMTQAFPEALDGPIAYGSSAYVDQADILRNFAAQLTPRGDTFVIRTYGDSLDPQGNVLARAWCEAVIQRIPEYVDPTDESHLKSSALQSEANKRFGRKLKIMSFRWLGDSEV